VKDAHAEIWDGGGAPPGDSRPGCWRPIGDGTVERARAGGRRFLASRWPTGNIDAQLTGQEVCNGFSAGSLTDPT
jgi:hypothetical protein